MKKNTAAWARDLACKHLASSLPRRWAHTQGVARQARTLAPILGKEADLLEAAAWLHDIGYAPDLVATGFHPLDGARHLRDNHHAATQLCRLVAHHSCAVIEARQRGLATLLTTEFDTSPPRLGAALTYCDMTTGPDGNSLAVEARLREIMARYGSEHLVARAITEASPRLVRAVHEIKEELRSVGG